MFLDEPYLTDEEKARQMIERISGKADADRFMQTLGPAATVMAAPSLNSTPSLSDEQVAAAHISRALGQETGQRFLDQNPDMAAARSMMDRAGNLERFDQWAKKPTDYFGLGAPIQANYDLKKLEVPGPYYDMPSASMQPGGILPDPATGEKVGPSYQLPSASMLPSGNIPNPALGATHFIPDTDLKKDFEMVGPMPMPNYRQQGDVRIDTGFNNLGEAVFNKPAANGPGAGYTYNDGKTISPIGYSTDRMWGGNVAGGSPLLAMMQDTDPYAEPIKTLGYAGTMGMTSGITDYSPVAAHRSAVRNNMMVARLMGDQDIARQGAATDLMRTQIAADSRKDMQEERNALMRERNADRFLQTIDKVPEGQRTPFIQEGVNKGYMDPAVGKDMLFREALLNAVRKSKGKSGNIEVQPFLANIASGFDKQGFSRQTLIEELLKMKEMTPDKVAAYEDDPVVGSFVKSILSPAQPAPKFEMPAVWGGMYRR